MKVRGTQGDYVNGLELQRYSMVEAAVDARSVFSYPDQVLALTQYSWN